MGISHRLHLTPNLLDVMTSAIPSLLHIRSVRIETTAVRVMVVGFRIDIAGNPALDGSCAQTNSASDLLDLHSLLTQCHDLLVAIIPLSLVSRVGLPSEVKRERGDASGTSAFAGPCTFGPFRSSARQCARAFSTASAKFFTR